MWGLGASGGENDKEQRSMGRRLKFSNPKLKRILLAIAAVAVFAVGAAAFIWTKYEVTTVTVNGNRHYTSEQIKEIVMEGNYGHNSLYLHYKYRNKSDLNIPFVQTMDVDIVSPSEISITVYEKAIAGYVEYLGRYMYFDKDGIVVESTTTQARDLPYVTGLKFDHVVMYEKLPVEDDQIFKEILSVTQLLSKYGIQTDKIYFDPNRDITLYFDKAKVQLGSMESIDEKMAGLRDIIPRLGGLSGTLDMRDYTEDRGNAKSFFQRDDVQKHAAISENSIIDSVSENEVSVSGNP